MVASDGDAAGEPISDERDLFLVALDVEGTLTPEAWLALQEKTGIEELKITTAHEPDYDKLMKYRIDVLRKNGIKLQDMRDVVQGLQPLPGAKEFLEWLKPIVPRVLLLTDTFEEYAMPMFEKLGYPTVFCNSLTVDEEGFITSHILRLKDQKRKAVEGFQRMNFRIIAIGDSFNDISMLKAAERGILYCPSEKVVKAHPEFPVVRSHDDLRMKVGRILGANMKVLPRPLKPPDLSEASRSMWLMICNVASTLAPEPWLAVQAKTGIEALKTTTAQEPDYDKLMKLRAAALKKHGVKLQDVFKMVEDITALPGAKDFLEWLKPIVPRTFILTDGFEEYALPIFDQLGHPMVFCNFLEADEEGYLAKHIIRLKKQKLRAVEEFQRLNFRIIAVGYSFNDVEMLSAAEAGILYCPSEKVTQAHPEFPVVHNHEQLKAKILDILAGGQQPKRQRTA
mmetsp:Transcript_74098/g.239594  ORF Transcript_74098/g.239594 Transcript_74098/m.239594 type:complete len:453 (-) Transcript_74098:95-1453(-)